ncbi:MAG TPA: type II secretion system protein [Rheinheimera sp.]|nr:type II secretion system protein [Rheinheimera sp.]
MNAKQPGFTLLELVVVLIIIGVLAVSLLPRFFDNSGTAEYLYQDQAANVLRRVQMQAMQCTSCTTPQVNVTANTLIATGGSCPNGGGALEVCVASRDNVSLALNAPLLTFDTLGRPSACTGRCEITIQGSTQLKLCIETEGYIHPC